MAGTFPKGFLWGTATAAHQVEGGNSASDLWPMEMMADSLFADPSGDACDQYHLYEHDIALLKGLGFDTYRFSIEWARIEPEEGFFSAAALDHYRRMIAACHALRVVPMVTFHHFTAPLWFTRDGGWENEASVDRFARYLRTRGRRAGRPDRLRLHHQRSQHPDHDDDDPRGAAAARARLEAARARIADAARALRRRAGALRALSIRQRRGERAQPDRRAPQGLRDLKSAG